MTSEQVSAWSRRGSGQAGASTNLFFAEVAFGGDTHRLASLLADDWEQRGNWFDHELGAMMAHQLKSLVEPQLGFKAQPLRPETGVKGRGGKRLTFQEAVFGEGASADCLRQVKEYAKARLTGSDPCFPPAIARVLYYGAILSARRRFGDRITSLGDAELRAGLEWVVEQDWVPARIRQWFRSGRQFIA